MSNITITVSVEEISKIYYWGVSEGQIIMEEERASEEIFDAMVCAHASRIFNVPSAPLQRRQLHSEKWFNAMRKDKAEFQDFIRQKIGGSE